MDRDKWGHSTTLSNLASVKSPGKVVWIATDNLGKRVLEFDWHQVARKSLVVGPDSVETRALTSVRILHMWRHHRLISQIGHR